jgi:carbonic anhydrase
MRQWGSPGPAMAAGREVTRHLVIVPCAMSHPCALVPWVCCASQRFVTGKLVDAHPTRNLDRVKATAGGQKPFAAFLSCADSRVPIEIIFDPG